MANRPVIGFCLSTFFILSQLTSLSFSNQTAGDEDRSFLDGPAPSQLLEDPDLPDDFVTTTTISNRLDTITISDSIDEMDVVVLSESNFTDLVASNRYVMITFYAPWCTLSTDLVPVCAAVATELKGEPEPVVFAKVDAQAGTDIAATYEVDGFPTILFFVDGVRTPYRGQRTKDAIVSWIKKKTAPAVYNITTTEHAEKILTSQDKVVLAYLNSLAGPESDQLAAASTLNDDDVNFYQTVHPDVAKLFHIDPQVKRPALVLLNKDAEKVNHYDGLFDKSAINLFVFANKLPLVTNFSRQSATSYFKSPIKKQVVLFATSNSKTTVFHTFVDAAKLFKGKLIFVYVETDNKDGGKSVANYFGITGDPPRVIGYTGIGNVRKLIRFDQDLTLENLKAFGEGFLDDKLKASYKSDPIPENNDGDVKIVVGNNFDDIVLDESKDVLLEIYAPWCGHCQALEPTYNKLAKQLRDINSLIIAKMDGTTNEHPRAKSDRYPMILFYPAGSKSSNPISVDVNRTVVAFYKFIEEHASVPFKLQGPTYTDAKESSEEGKIVQKDELR